MRPERRRLLYEREKNVRKLFRRWYIRLIKKTAKEQERERDIQRERENERERGRMERKLRC